MIENLAKKIVTQYDNLPPRKKAMADIAGIFLGSVIGSLIVVAILNFGLWFELAMVMICYGVWGMIKLLYKSRVDYYETQAHLKDWK